MGEMIQQMDFQILDWIQANIRSPWLDWLAPKITFLCDGGWFWILITLLFLLWKKNRRWGGQMVIGLILCVIFGNLLLKHLAARPRPCWINQDILMLVPVPKDFSFPSGHSMVSMTISTILLRFDRRVGIPAVILAVLIALSRLYLYVHFPTDVLVGGLMGILFGWLSGRILQRLEQKRSTAAQKETAGADEAE